MTRPFKERRTQVRSTVIFIHSIIFLLLTVQKTEAQSKPWTIPATASGMKNPLPGNPTTIKEGKVLYTSYCSPCHGEKGKGDGIAAVALNPKPADHTSAKVQNETDGTLFFMMSEGRDPMPQYKRTLTENQRWELVAYIRTLAKTGKK
jgi:mono/diheme cytochrome c family protein